MFVTLAGRIPIFMSGNRPKGIEIKRSCELICQINTAVLHCNEPLSRIIVNLHSGRISKKDYEIMKTDLQATLESIQADIAKRDTRFILIIAGLLIAGMTIQGFILN